MKNCRKCNHEVADDALTCPNCGEPYPSQKYSKGWGFEYKDKTTIFGYPLVHVSFKYKPSGVPVPAKGIISIGQFGIGVINISQFGIGVISISQFAIGGYVVSQIGVAYELVAQIGLYIHSGYGQFVYKLMDFF